MSDNVTIKVEGPSALTLLFISFVVLKLTKVIAWSWWWVTAPIWLPLALGLVIGLFAILIVAVFD